MSTKNLNIRKFNHKIYSSINEVKKDLQIYLGEYHAGNKNKEVKNTISILAHFLYQQKAINKTQYNKILHLIIK